MRKHTHRWCQTPPSVTVRVKPSSTHSIQKRRCLRFKRTNGQDTQGPPGKSQSSQRRDELYHAKMSTPPTIVIQMQEMASFFRLLGKWIALWKACFNTVASKWYILLLNLLFTLRIKNIWHLTSKYLLFIFFFTDDDLIRDFLWMDCCCKMTDKVNCLVNVLMKVTQSL